MFPRQRLPLGRGRLTPPRGIMNLPIGHASFSVHLRNVIFPAKIDLRCRALAILCALPLFGIFPFIVGDTPLCRGSQIQGRHSGGFAPEVRSAFMSPAPTKQAGASLVSGDVHASMRDHQPASMPGESVFALSAETLLRVTMQPECSGDLCHGTVELVSNAPLVLRCTLINDSAEAVRPGSVSLRFEIHTPQGQRSDRTFIQGGFMTGATRLANAATDLQASAGVCAWLETRTGAATLGGVLDHGRANCTIFSEGTGPIVGTIRVDWEDKDIQPGARLELPPVIFSVGASLSSLLEDYAERVAATMKASVRKPVESGWCSWYHYYGRETFGEVMQSAQELRAAPISKGVQTIQIDDGWNRAASRNEPKDWGQWTAHPDKFPAGMRDAVERIHEQGFRAGLWLAPFSIEESSDVFREHPEWLVRRLNRQTGAIEPQPTDHPTVYQLDCTHPGALEWIGQTFHRVFREWGFDYAKVDFLTHGAKPGLRFDSSATSVEAYRRGLQVIRDAAGADRFVLGCGAPLLASVGMVDGMRVGPDVGGRWHFDAGMSGWPSGNCSLRAAAIPSLWSQWMHGRWWQNDPDCLLVRARPPIFETQFFDRLEQTFRATGKQIISTPLGLSDEEAGCWSRFVWMSGGMALLSDVWSELPGNRRRMLEKCFPPHNRACSLLDWHHAPAAGGLVLRDHPLTVGFFNFADEPVQPEYTDASPKLPQDAEWVERWSGQTCRTRGQRAKFPELPPRSGRVWELRCAGPDCA